MHADPSPTDPTPTDPEVTPRRGRPAAGRTALARQLHLSGLTYEMAAAITGLSRSAIAQIGRGNSGPIAGRAILALHGKRLHDDFQPFDARPCVEEYVRANQNYKIPRPHDPRLRAVLLALAMDPDGGDIETLYTIARSVLPVIAERFYGNLVPRHNVGTGISAMGEATGCESDSIAMLNDLLDNTPPAQWLRVAP